MILEEPDVFSQIVTFIVALVIVTLYLVSMKRL